MQYTSRFRSVLHCVESVILRLDEWATHPRVWSMVDDATCFNHLHRCPADFHQRFQWADMFSLLSRALCTRTLLGLSVSFGVSQLVGRDLGGYLSLV